MRKTGVIGSIFVGFLCVVGLVMLLFCAKKIPAGYCGIKYNISGGISDEVLTQGWHVVSPATTVTLYSIGIEQSYLTSTKNGDSPDDESFSASSSEGKELIIDLTFTYQYNIEDVTGVFNRFRGQSGKDVLDSFIKPNIISRTKEVVARYKVADIIGSKRSEVNDALTEYLFEKFKPYGITISNVSLINVAVDSETMEAINKKITAQQDAETQAINNQTAIDKATADASVTTTTAQAKADAQLIEAQAQAEANKMISESLTSELIEQKKIDKWNGDVPKVSGGNMASIIDLGDITGEVVQ